MVLVINHILIYGLGWFGFKPLHPPIKMQLMSAYTHRNSWKKEKKNREVFEREYLLYE
jgi:hypothetical protein